MFKEKGFHREKPSIKTSSQNSEKNFRKGIQYNGKR